MPVTSARTDAMDRIRLLVRGQRVAVSRWLATGLLAAAAVPAAAQVDYTLSLLQPSVVKRGEVAAAMDINAAGQMVGRRYTIDGSAPARWVLWSAIGKPTNLQSNIPGAEDLRAEVINGSGFAAGQLYVNNFPAEQGVKATLILPTGEVRVIAPEEANYSVARAINDLGVVVGEVQKQERPKHITAGFIWSEQAGWREIPSPPGREPRVSIKGVNNAGVVIGENSTWPRRAFYYSDEGGLHWLPKEVLYTTAINDRNEIVGWTLRNAAFVFRPGGPLRRLPGLVGTSACRAVDINDAGIVVGYCVTRAFRFIAVTWERIHGVYRVADLNRRIAGAGAGGSPHVGKPSLTSAQAISDAGQIISFFRADSGAFGTAILTPKERER